MPAIPALIGVAGSIAAAKISGDAQKKAASIAANAAANGGSGTVDTAALQAQAQNVARENAANSAALEAQYNPGAAQLRAGSLQSLIAALSGPDATQSDLISRISAQAGQPLAVGGPQQYDSALTRQAVEAAANDLALGGQLPQDVRNLIARRSLAHSGAVTGRLDLGRDLTTRDLGLTSLDLQRQRLATAAALGQQEAALNAGNAGLRVQNDAQRLAADQFGRTNLLQSGDFMQQVANGEFGRALAAAQLGQNIAQPASGLDPGAVANLAVGNSNAAANAAQNLAAQQIAAANQKSAMTGQIIGSGLGLVQSYFANKTPSYSSPASGYYSPPLGGNSSSAAYVRSN